MDLEYTGVTHLGNVRKNNEDSFIMEEAKTADGTIKLLAVADGLGGHDGGEIASGKIVDELKNWLLGLIHIRTENVIEHFKVHLEKINTEIHTYFTTLETSGGSTLTGIMILDNTAYTFNTGDSRVYRIRKHTMEVLTWDHSLRNYQVKAGLIEHPDEIGKKGDMLIKAFGIDESLTIDIKEVKLKKNDLLVICSDGLYGAIELNQEKGLYKKIKNRDDLLGLSRDLLIHVLEGEAKDNITYILAKCS